MVNKDNLADMLNHIVNCKRVGKFTCNFSPANKLMLDLLEVMSKKGYIKEFKVSKEVKGNELEIMIGNLNYCKAIKPRFNVKSDGHDKFVRRFLPSRNLGILIVSTSKGLITHDEAIERRLGGKLIAFCY
ncbi:MAG: 30S ribosomal protein S8 [Nanoarchaeota archaeon]